MRKNPLFLSACPLLLLLCGCVFESYRPVNEFDLVPGKPVETARELRILEFRNDSTAGVRLQSREESGRVVRDPYNSWALPPGQLIARTLNLALRPAKGGAAEPVVVEGTLEVFELDAAARNFRLAGSWAPQAGNKRFLFDFSVPVEGNSAESTAQAAAAAARLLAEQIGDWSRSAAGPGNGKP